MTLFELQQKIKNNDLPRFLIFTGTEYAIINLYLDQIQKMYKLKRQNIQKISQVVQKQKIISITGENNLYVCRYDLEFTRNEKDWKYINSSVKDNYLIMIQLTLDKRGKFYKQFEDVCVEFSEQDDATLSLMLKNKIKLPEKQLKELIDGCGKNYSRCILEIDKVKHLSQLLDISEEKSYDKLVSDGTICQEVQSELPKFINAVMTRDVSCYDLYHRLQLNGESNIVILTWLYNAVKNQLIVQSVNKASQDTTGLSYFFIKECLDRKGFFTTRQLMSMLYLIKSCEQGIKNGLFEEPLVIDYILVNIL